MQFKINNSKFILSGAETDCLTDDESQVVIIMNRNWKYLLFLVWLSYLYVCGVLLFTRGFLLSRRSLHDRSTCVENVDCSGYLKISEEDPSPLNTQIYLDCLDRDQLKLRAHGGEDFRCTKSDKKIVLLLIDALRYDFAKYDHSLKDGELKPFQNRLTIIDELLQTVPNNTLLFKFIANPPTTTMQRLKGLTTGSLPTFVDIGSNFAASEINEDNILDQLLDQKKNIVFMGDDTWTALYPKRFKREYPFPSFNVWDLDTVDDGVLAHLKPEIQKKDWSLLIAHFLGVDHCGHRYGPYHSEMTRKLNQMDSLIRDISNTIDENTILIVMGDHGMTQSGDHGGESREEVTSALFLYSPVPFLSSKLTHKSDMVYQVDLVPTISALLGFPIPFSNLGKIVLEALPLPLVDVNEESISPDAQSYALNILQNNVEQIMLYVNTYSRQIQVFSKEKISALSQKFYALKKKSDSINDTESFNSFHKDTLEFLNFLREMCESVWVQFDSFSMSRGLVLTFLLISFTFFIVEGIPSEHFTSVLEGKFLWVAYSIIVLCAGTSAALQYYRIVEDMFVFTYVSTLTVSIITMAKIVVQHWVEITNLWYTTSRNRKWLDILSRFIHLCSVLLLFSNSFVVEEGMVLSFLLNAIVWLTVFNNFTPEHDYHYAKNKASDKFQWARKLFNHPKIRQIMLAFFFTLLLRISHYYWRCREEQKWCLMGAENSGYFSTLKTGRTSYGSMFTILLLAVFVSLIRLWLRSCGNLVGFAPMVVFVRYMPNVIVVCTGGFWVLQNLPQEMRSKLFVPWQLQILPWTVLVLIGIALVLLFFHPISVFTVAKKTDMFSIYGHVNIIPQLFIQIRNVIRNSENNEKDSTTNNTPRVYGLGTVYSAAFVMLGEFVSLFIILLLGDILASSMMLMVAVSTTFLVLVAFSRLDSTLLNAQLFHVPWSYVLSWGLISSYFFYGTGHQPTFPSIQWNAAFIGTGGQFDSNIIPSILIVVNTFCSQIFCGLTLPLLFVTPFSFYVMFSKIFSSNSHQVDKSMVQGRHDLKQGDLYLYENQHLSEYAVFKLSAKYILYHGTRIFCSMLAAAIHCRHLMVWMIFAPRFIFEGIAFFVTLGSVLVGHLLMIRVTAKVDELVNELVKKQS